MFTLWQLINNEYDAVATKKGQLKRNHLRGSGTQSGRLGGPCRRERPQMPP